MMQVMSGEATPAQIAGVPDRAADEGRDGRGDRRLRPGDARARDAGAAPPRDAGGHLRHRRRRRRTPSTSPPRPRWWPPARASPSPSTATARCRRAAARPTCWRRWACASTCAPEDVAALHRRGRLRLPVRPGPPPGHAPRRPGAARAGRAHRVQPARAADQPGRRPPPGDRRATRRDLVEPIAQALAALGAEHALVVHGAGGLDELTPTGENLVAEVRDGEVTHHDGRPARASAPGPGSAGGPAGGGDAVGQRRHRSHRLRRRDAARAATP